MEYSSVEVGYRLWGDTAYPSLLFSEYEPEWSVELPEEVEEPLDERTWRRGFEGCFEKSELG